MAWGIDIDPDEVSRAASKIRSAAQNINDTSRTFEHIENDIEDSWKSQYTSQYISIIDDTYSRVKRTASRLQSISDNLDKIAQEVRRAEREIQLSMMRSDD